MVNRSAVDAATVAAHGLPGAEGALAGGPIGGREWARLLDELAEHRVLGLLVASIVDGALVVSDAQRGEAAEAHAMAQARVLTIEHAALGVVGVLEEAGVAVRVLKGLATAYLDRPDPAQREFRDADLLVEPGRFSTAVRVLTGAGLTRDLPERRRGFDECFGKEATLYWQGSVEIDLHRTLALGPFGLALDPRQLWDAGAEPFTVGGRTLNALAPEARLLHACYDAVLGGRTARLATLRDVAELAGRAGLDIPAVLALARSARGEAVVAAGILAAGAALRTGLEWPLWPWAASYVPSARERVWLAAYESGGGTNTLTLLAGALAVRPRGPYLAGLAFPAAAYRRARRVAGRAPEWRRGLTELRRPRAG